MLQSYLSCWIVYTSVSYGYPWTMRVRASGFLHGLSNTDFLFHMTDRLSALLEGGFNQCFRIFFVGFYSQSYCHLVSFSAVSCTELVDVYSARFARISMALSLARIFPPGHLARKLSIFLSGGFVSLFFVVTGLVIGLCQGRGLPWHTIDPNNCKTGSLHIPIPGLVGIVCGFYICSLLATWIKSIPISRI